MSEKYRKAVKTRLAQERDRLGDTIRTIQLLMICEHPDWGEPGAEAAHKAALAVIRSKEPWPQRGLPTEVIDRIRRYYRPIAGLPMEESYEDFFNENIVKSPRSLRPSSQELSKQELLTEYCEPSPEDVALPDEDDDAELNDLRQQGPYPVPSNSTISSSTTVTTRALATLMRLQDRCPVTLAGLKQLKELWKTTSKQIKQIDASQKAFRRKLKERTLVRYRRWWGPEYGSEQVPLGLARGFGSRLTRYTSIEDADDPWGGEKDARYENKMFWVPESKPREREVKW